MATRDEKRRELRDVARLASVIPKEHTAPPPPSVAPANGGSQITVSSAVSSVRPSRAVTQPPRAQLPLPRPPPRFRLRSSIPPPATALASATGQGSSGRRGWAVLAGATLAAAMVVGLGLGEVLTSKPTGALHRDTELGVAAGPVDLHAAPSAEAPMIPTPVAGSAAPANDLTTAAAPPLVTITGACPPPSAAARTPRLPHHPPQSTVSRAPMSSPVAAGGSGRTLVAAKGKSTSRTAGRDSLEDLIRKAAGSN